MQLLVNYITMVPGGILMGMTTRRFLPAKRGWLLMLILVLLFGVVIIMPSWIGDENPLFLFPFFLAAFLFCFTGHWYARLVIGVVFYTLLIPLNMMIDSAIAYDKPYVYTIIAKTLLWGIIWLIVRRFVSKDMQPVRAPKLWALLGGLSLAPLFATLSLTIWHISKIDETVYETVVLRLAYIVLPFTVMSAIALLAAVVVLSRHEELERQQKLAEIQEVYYRDLKREQFEVRTLRHDLHNHITAAQGLLEQGDTDGAKRYLENLSQSSALAGSRCFCDNDIANAVLSSKAAMMEHRNIQADWEISLPKTLSISDIDLCALLGNALDNAIEAVSGAQDKRIVLRARADKGILMLRVENAVGGSFQIEDGVFKTTKEDKRFHGFGLANMQDIARRYGGSLEVTAENGRFELLAYFPVHNKADVHI